MRRRLFTLAWVGSLLLCVTAAGLWAAAAVVGPRTFVTLGYRRDGAAVVQSLGGVEWNRAGVYYHRREDHWVYGQTYDPAGRLVGDPSLADLDAAARLEGRLLAGADEMPLSGLRADDGRSFSYYSTGPGLTRYKTQVGPYDTVPRTIYHHYAGLVVPFYLPVLAAAALPAAVFAARVRRRWRRARAVRLGWCPACGYDLRASAGRCPECGAAPTAEV
jgi:YD repeat-containing protein